MKTKPTITFSAPKPGRIKALDYQVGTSNHYSKLGIQPVEYIMANGVNYLDGNVIKYVTRHGSKNGVEDLKKALHYVEMSLDHHYPGWRDEKPAENIRKKIRKPAPRKKR